MTKRRWLLTATTTGNSSPEPFSPLFFSMGDRKMSIETYQTSVDELVRFLEDKMSHLKYDLSDDFRTIVERYLRGENIQSFITPGYDPSKSREFESLGKIRLVLNARTSEIGQVQQLPREKSTPRLPPGPSAIAANVRADKRQQQQREYREWWNV